MSDKPVFRSGDPVQFATNVTSAPAIPAPDAGPDISALQNATKHSTRRQHLALVLNSGSTLTLTKPVVCYGELDGRVGRIGTLNGGEDITITANNGYFELLNAVGIYDRFIVIPAAITGGGGFDGFLRNVGGVE